jgi:hypothetical protein
MSELLRRLQKLGDAEHDDLSVGYDASEEIIALRARVAELEAALADLCACDWVITFPDRIERVRDIARRALDGAEGA